MKVTISSLNSRKCCLQLSGIQWEPCPQSWTLFTTLKQEVIHDLRNSLHRRDQEAAPIQEVGHPHLTYQDLEAPVEILTLAPAHPLQIEYLHA